MPFLFLSWAPYSNPNWIPALVPFNLYHTQMSPVLDPTVLHRFGASPLDWVGLGPIGENPPLEAGTVMPLPPSASASSFLLVLPLPDSWMLNHRRLHRSRKHRDCRLHRTLRWFFPSRFLPSTRDWECRHRARCRGCCRRPDPPFHGCRRISHWCFMARLLLVPSWSHPSRPMCEPWALYANLALSPLLGSVWIPWHWSSWMYSW